MSSQVHALADKMFQKYQQTSVNFSNCNGVYFQKKIISKTGECVFKKNPATIAFLYWDINLFKLSKFSIYSLIKRDFPFSAFPFID